jgi:hypothetical protein
VCQWRVDKVSRGFRRRVISSFKNSTELSFPSTPRNQTFPHMLPSNDDDVAYTHSFLFFFFLAFD